METSPDMSEYEQQRQRNIEANQAMLDALGLGNAPNPLSPRMTNQLVPYKPCIRKKYEIDALRQLSLRERQEKEKGSTSRKGKVAAARSSRAAKRSTKLVALRIKGPGIVSVPSSHHAPATSEESPPRKPETGKAKSNMIVKHAGQRGGWNASTDYEGVAIVRGRGISTRTIAIRKRGNNRLYGYVGRSQISWNCGMMGFPAVVCAGITVLKYTEGGRLEHDNEIKVATTTKLAEVLGADSSNMPKAEPIPKKKIQPFNKMRPRGRAPKDADGNDKIWNYETGAWEE